MRITLDEEMERMAIDLGRTRRAESIHLPDKHGFDGTNADFIDINGAAGEIALAIALGIEPDPHVNVFRVADVSVFHVRTTESHGNRLIIRSEDPDGIYVLVTGHHPEMWIRGCIDSRRARKMDQYVRAPNGREPAWFIPVGELSSFNKMYDYWRSITCN